MNTIIVAHLGYVKVHSEKRKTLYTFGSDKIVTIILSINSQFKISFD
jgi:hypothetical protein